jgi:5-methylcytosine-specific restriction endonuclease McrA
MSSRDWSSGSSKAWRKLRARILERDQHRCQLKLPGCTTIATDAHHILGKIHGDNPDQIVAACGHCNKTVGEPTRHDPQPTPRTRW